MKSGSAIDGHDQEQILSFTRRKIEHSCREKDVHWWTRIWRLSLSKNKMESSLKMTRRDLEDENRRARVYEL